MNVCSRPTLGFYGRSIQNPSSHIHDIKLRAAGRPKYVCECTSRIRLQAVLWDVSSFTWGVHTAPTLKLLRPGGRDVSVYLRSSVMLMRADPVIGPHAVHHLGRGMPADYDSIRRVI